MTGRLAPADFAAKLRMTAIALRCNSRKELCARFRAVNPATHCDVDRMHKWMQGRAFPRSMQILDDLAKVLGSDRSGAWLGRCSLVEFAEEVAGATGISVDELTPAAGTAQPAAPPPPATAGIMGGLRTLAGHFACYSPAWSPHYEGRLVRGSLRILLSAGGQLNASYAETVAGWAVTMTAPLVVTGRVIHVQFREPEGNLPLFILLHLPGSPASVMTGIMAGAAFLSHDPLPTAGGFVAVRVPDATRLEATNRYIDFQPNAIASDLAALGLPQDLAAQTAVEIAACLGERTHTATTTGQRRLSALLDGRLLD